MTVNDVMTRRVATCRPETNLAAASALMWENDCGILPVLAETGEVTGVLTDRDICIAAGTRDERPSELRASEVARTSPWTCKSTDDLRLALQIMRDAGVRRLPVVSPEGELEGIVSISDIALNVRRGLGTVGAPAVSDTDVVDTLQAICSAAGRLSTLSIASHKAAA